MNRRSPDSAANRIEAEAATWIARHDAGLTPAEKREFEIWRAADPRHADAFGRFTLTWSALGRPRRTGSSDRLTRELNALRRRQRFRPHYSRC